MLLLAPLWLLLTPSLPTGSPAVLQDEARPAAPILRQVTVDVSGSVAQRAAELLAADFDLLHVHADGRALELLCDDEELARLRALGLAPRVVHQDLAAFYADRLAAGASRAAGAPRLGAWLSPPFGQGSMGGYYTLAEVVSVLDQIAAAHPALVTPRFSIGTSHEGRELWAVELSDNPGVQEGEPEVRFDSLHHAREPQSMQCTLWTLLHLVEGYGSDPLATSIVDERRISFVPVVNPDGYVYNQLTNPGGGGLWRKNRRDNLNGTAGVDLNRNYPYQWGYDSVGSKGAKSSETYRGPSPASEPEVAAMVGFMAAHDFRTALSTHTYSGVWLYPWGYAALTPANLADYVDVSRYATELSGYRFGAASVVLYLANGVTIDYEQDAHGTLSWTPEIGDAGDGFWPARQRIVPLAEETLEGFLRTALAAGSHPYAVDVTATDEGDGDGFYEPGEPFELVFRLHNGGRDATGGGVQVSVVSASPSIVVTQPAATVPAIAPFADGDHAGTPIAITIAPGAPIGSTASYTLQVDWDGLTQLEQRSITIGRPVDLVTDDLEADLGWVAGVPGDTATGGLWEYGNPKPTYGSGGVVASPDDDATPGNGKRCFVTGNGTLTFGLDDVDDGTTTLISPRIDLAGAALARLSYARWFGDRLTEDDVLEVSLSDDDGASWTMLESLDTPDYAWTRRTFSIGDYVSLSDSVRLRFVLSDAPDNSNAEACVDDLCVEVYETTPRLSIYGRPAIGTSVAFHTTAPDGGDYGIFQSTGTGFFPFQQIQGALLLDPLALELVQSGTAPASGTARDVLPIPASPSLVGQTLYFQALVAAPSGLFLTNRDELLFE